MGRNPHPARRMALTVLVVLAHVGAAQAGSVTSAQTFRRGGWLHVSLQARDVLDARTVSTVESGLPGSCMYRIQLEDRAGATVGERVVELSVRLDLWENQYVVRGPHGSSALATLAAADSALSHLDAVRLLPVEHLNASREYRVQVEVEVQPLGAHDQARISRYVSQNTRGPRQEFALNLSALFHRVFGSRGGSESTGAPFYGPFFTPAELEESP